MVQLSGAAYFTGDVTSEKIRLGKTNMLVSRLGFGGIPIQRLNEDEGSLWLKEKRCPYHFPIRDMIATHVDQYQTYKIKYQKLELSA